jgi:hypothetical protein
MQFELLLFLGMTAFFTLTMLSVVVLSSANGVYQNSIYGLAASFPSNFTNAVVIGNNVCGIFVTVVLILTLLCKFNLLDCFITMLFSFAKCQICGAALLHRCTCHNHGLFVFVLVSAKIGKYLLNL